MRRYLIKAYFKTLVKHIFIQYSNMLAIHKCTYLCMSMYHVQTWSNNMYHIEKTILPFYHDTYERVAFLHDHASHISCIINSYTLLLNSSKKNKITLSILVGVTCLPFLKEFFPRNSFKQLGERLPRTSSISQVASPTW